MECFLSRGSTLSFFTILTFFTCFSEIAFVYFIMFVRFSRAKKRNSLCSSSEMSEVRRRFPSPILIIYSFFQTTYLICNATYNFVSKGIISILESKKSHVLKKNMAKENEKVVIHHIGFLNNIVLDNNLIIINKIRLLEQTT